MKVFNVVDEVNERFGHGVKLHAEGYDVSAVTGVRAHPTEPLLYILRHKKDEKGRAQHLGKEIATETVTVPREVFRVTLGETDKDVTSEFLDFVQGLMPPQGD